MSPASWLSSLGEESVCDQTLRSTRTDDGRGWASMERSSNIMFTIRLIRPLPVHLLCSATSCHFLCCTPFLVRSFMLVAFAGSRVCCICMFAYFYYSPPCCLMFAEYYPCFLIYTRSVFPVLPDVRFYILEIN